MKTTYHLYQHQPEPLSIEHVHERQWTLNNAGAYTLAATIAASSETEALQAAQLKAHGQKVPRTATITVGSLFRETHPGDVILAEYAAWMVNPAGALQAIAYQASPVWKHLRQRDGQFTAPTALAWSPDGTLLATGDTSRIVLHVVESDNRFPNGYERRASTAAPLAWSPRGDRIASAGTWGEVHLWRPAPYRHGASIGSILICRTEEASISPVTVHALAWSLDGTQLFAGRHDGSVVGWEAQTGSLLVFHQCHTKAVIALAFSPQSEPRHLTASVDGTVRIWDRSIDNEVTYHHTAEVVAAIWSPDGTLVASCEHQEPAIHLWRASTGELMERLALSLSSTQGIEVCTLAWSPDGRVLAAGCNDSTIHLFDVRRRRHIHTFRVDTFHRTPVVALAFSPDGMMLAAGDGSMGTDLWRLEEIFLPSGEAV